MLYYSREVFMSVFKKYSEEQLVKYSVNGEEQSVKKPHKIANNGEEWLFTNIYKSKLSDVL